MRVVINLFKPAITIEQIQELASANKQNVNQQDKTMKVVKEVKSNNQQIVDHARKTIEANGFIADGALYRKGSIVMALVQNDRCEIGLGVFIGSTELPVIPLLNIEEVGPIIRVLSLGCDGYLADYDSIED
jgi:hypothetical protein